MKNKERYREELIENCKKCTNCDFIRNIIMPTFDTSCQIINCRGCQILVSLWLDDEYKHPEYWSKIPVNTPVLVRHNKNGKWFLRLFAKYDDGMVFTYPLSYFKETIGDHKSIDKYLQTWNYIKLATSEDIKGE